MVPNRTNAIPNLVARLHGDGTGLSAECFGFEFTLFQYQSMKERQQFTIQRYLTKMY